MREIKFRAWDKDIKRMFEVVSLRLNNNTTVVKVCGGFNGKSICENQVLCNNILEIMQYTGLKDKNGVEIYEGDYFLDADGFVMIVVWIEEDACFGLEWHEGIAIDNMDKEYCDIEPISFMLTEEMKVEGNIYENKDNV